MAENLEELFYELLRVSVGTQENLSRLPDEVEWGELLDMAVKQSLVGVCFVGLHNLGADADDGFCYIGMSEDLYLNWMGMAAKINMKNETVNHQCAELQSNLYANGFRSSILKGQGVAVLYGEKLQGFRQSGDIDVFLPVNREKVLGYVNTIAPTNEVNHQHVQLHCFEDTGVELHYIAAELHCPWHDKHLQRFFSRNGEMVKVNLNAAGEITVPCEAFNIVHLLAHAYRHMFGDGIGLRQTMDLFFALKTSSIKSSEDLCNDIRGVVNKTGMKRFASAMVWVLQHVFGLDSSASSVLIEGRTSEERDGQFLLAEIMMAGNFGKYDYRIDRKGESHWHRFWRVTKQNLRLMRFSPWEVICTPIWRIWHFAWMRMHGYTQG